MSLPARSLRCLGRCTVNPAITAQARNHGFNRAIATQAGSSSRQSRYRWTGAAAGASALFLASALFASPLLLEDRKQDDSKKPKFTKEQVGVICIIGGPKSGKSTQLQNIIKRFDIKQLNYSDDVAALGKQVEEAVSNGRDGKKPRVIIEGFPRTISQSDKFEAEVAPILVIISIVLDSPKALDRIDTKIDKNDAKINWKRFDDNSEPIIKKFRFQGNILEITGEWPADEVWEQVEAKLESALELDDRGEL